jgi:hypothetical protein
VLHESVTKACEKSFAAQSAVPTIEVASPMDPESVLTFQCPHTGRAIFSTIRTHKTALAKLGDLKISVWCPVCEAPHKIACNEASLVHSLPSETG